VRPDQAGRALAADAKARSASARRDSGTSNAGRPVQGSRTVDQAAGSAGAACSPPMKLASLGRPPEAVTGILCVPFRADLGPAQRNRARRGAVQFHATAAPGDRPARLPAGGTAPLRRVRYRTSALLPPITGS